MELPDNPIPKLVAQYRVLKRQADALKSEMDSIRAELLPHVEAMSEPWKDGDGYARVTLRLPSMSYESKAVNSLAETWANSDDPVMKSCGEMLLSGRKMRAGYSYLEVK